MVRKGIILTKMEQIKNKLKGYGLTDSTIKTYISILKQFFNHSKKTNNFTQEEISNYLDYLMVVKDYCGRSRNLAMKIIKFYCREFLNFEPELKKAKEAKNIQPVCWDDDFKQIYEVTINPKQRLCLLLMRYSGLRKGEVIKVRRHDILSDGRLFVKGGKGQKDRYTITPPQIKDQLNSYMNLLPAGNPYLFHSQDGKGHYSSDTPNAILKNAFNKLGWHKSRRYGSHALRRFWVIFTVETLKLDFDEVSKMAGHSIMRTTQIYTQSRKLKLNEAIARYKEVSCVIH